MITIAATSAGGSLAPTAPLPADHVGVVFDGANYLVYTFDDLFTASPGPRVTPVHSGGAISAAAVDAAAAAIKKTVAPTGLQMSGGKLVPVNTPADVPSISPALQAKLKTGVVTIINQLWDGRTAYVQDGIRHIE